MTMLNEMNLSRSRFAKLAGLTVARHFFPGVGKAKRKSRTVAPFDGKTLAHFSNIALRLETEELLKQNRHG
jgi:hypothetical protein